MKKRIIISLSMAVGLVVLILVGCVMSRDTVRVTDAVSGKPIRGVQVVPVYPSFGGATYLTDKRGVARVGGYGLPRGAAGNSVEVSAPGYEHLSVPMFGSATNHLEVTLKPAPKP